MSSACFTEEETEARTVQASAFPCKRSSLGKWRVCSSELSRPSPPPTLHAQGTSAQGLAWRPPLHSAQPQGLSGVHVSCQYFLSMLVLRCILKEENLECDTQHEGLVLNSNNYKIINTI